MKIRYESENTYFCTVHQLTANMTCETHTHTHRVLQFCKYSVNIARPFYARSVLCLVLYCGVWGERSEDHMENNDKCKTVYCSFYQREMIIKVGFVFFLLLCVSFPISILSLFPFLFLLVKMLIC